jgi:hypothetical protein
MRQKRKYPVGARLYIKLRRLRVRRGAVSRRTLRGFTDIYITSEDGDIYDLHASAKLGERRLDGDKWLEWSNQVIPHILARARAANIQGTSKYCQSRRDRCAYW